RVSKSTSHQKQQGKDFILVCKFLIFLIGTSIVLFIFPKQLGKNYVLIKTKKNRIYYLSTTKLKRIKVTR
ncbi:MAG: hypothetical protein AAFY76_06745, partial [Cyanobacteria bacterium J06649_11]